MKRIHEGDGECECECSCDLCERGGCKASVAPWRSVDGIMEACLCDKGERGFYYRKCVHNKKSHKYDRNFKKCTRSGCGIEDAIKCMTACALKQKGDVEVSWKAIESVEITASKKQHADIADAYGEHQRTQKETKQVTKTAALRDFIQLYAQQCRLFFQHREVAHWQAQQYDKCIDGLPQNHIAILIDYSMNFSHIHLEEVAGEHWAHAQTTLVPVVVYKNINGKVEAHSRIYMSNDLNHSNKMVQFILEDTTKKEQTLNPDLAKLHIWSDGCGGQLKNRYQCYWLTYKLGNVRVRHNFFQSCHGKGPSDSEGAVVRSYLRRLTFVFNKRINTSKEAYDWCAVAKEGERLRNPQHKGQKKRHTIMSRSFTFVHNGDVDHLSTPDLKPVEGIKSHFCFTGASGSQGELEFTERSCYEDASCFEFETSKCNHTRYTGPCVKDLDMQENTNATPTTRAAFQTLAKKVKKAVKQNTNVVIRLRADDGYFCLAKATGKVRKLTSSEIDKQAKQLLATNHLVDVVFVWQYAEEATGSSSASKQYTLEAERCDQLREFCQCKMQHMSVYKACCIREPIGFKLKVPDDGVRLRRGKRAHGSEKQMKKLAYVMPAGLRQNIDNNLDPVGVEFE